MMFNQETGLSYASVLAGARYKLKNAWQTWCTESMWVGWGGLYIQHVLALMKQVVPPCQSPVVHVLFMKGFTSIQLSSTVMLIIMMMILTIPPYKNVT